MRSIERKSISIITILLVLTLLLSMFAHLFLSSVPDAQLSQQPIAEINTGQIYFTNALTRSGEALNWSDEICLTNNISDSWNPQIAIDDNNKLHLTFIDDRTQIDEWYRNIFYMSSDNSGNDWSNEKIIGLGADTISMGVEKSSDDIHLVWRDWPQATMSGGFTWHIKSSSQGASWSERVDGGAWSLSNYHFQMAVSEENLYFPSNIYYGTTSISASYDGGDGWIQLDYPSLIDDKLSIEPNIIAAEDDLYVITSMNNDEGLYLFHSVDKGETWEIPTEILNRSTEGKFHPVIATAVDNESIYVVTSYDNYDDSGGYQLYFLRGSREGTEWDIIRKISWEGKIASYPKIAVDDSSSNIHLVWEENLANKYIVCYEEIDTEGRIIVNRTIISDIVSNASNPDVALDNYGYVHVVWQDDRNGNLDIYYTRYPGDDITPPEITHEPISEVDTDMPIQINATVGDNIGVNDCSLYYRRNNSDIFTATEMNMVEGSPRYGFWQASIPPQITNITVQYYILANDTNGNDARLPTEGYFEVAINDTISPTINHRPINRTFAGQNITIFANVTDNFQVENVTLSYFKENNSNQISSLNMTLLSGTLTNGTYSCIIPPQESNTTLKYYILATDVNGNSATLNMSQPFSITISQSSTNSTSSGFLANLDGGFVVLLFVIVILIGTTCFLIFRKRRLKNRDVNRIQRRGSKELKNE